jgi:hypothetical protein
MEIEQPEPPDLLTAMSPQEIDQPMRRRDIGPHRVRRAPAIMGEMASPARCQGARRMSFGV